MKYLEDRDLTLYQGDVREVLRSLPDESVHCVVTSPPYWGLRDYGTGKWEGGDEGCDHLEKVGGTGSSTLGAASGGNDMSDEARERSTTRSFVEYREVCGKCGARRIDNQLGLEFTPEQYLSNMVEVFREVRRVLRKDGTTWVNLGDSYNAYNGNAGPASGIDKPDGARTTQRPRLETGHGLRTKGLKPKDLCMIPARLALALQADGWYLRSQIVWSKPNPMPESVAGSRAVRHRVTMAEYENLSRLREEERAAQDRPGDVSEVQAREVSDRQAPLSAESEGAGDGTSTRRTPGGEGEAATVLGVTAGPAEPAEIPGDREGQGDPESGAAQIRGERARQSGCGGETPADEGRSEAAGAAAGGRSTVQANAEGQGAEVPRARQAEGRDPVNRESADSGGLGGDRGEAPVPLPLLRPEGEADGGSRDPAEQGRRALEDERRSGVPVVQQQEGQSDGLVDCPGCAKCLANDGYILRMSAGRPTTSHEFVYLLAKSPRYFFDQEAVREPHSREWWDEAQTHPGNPDRNDGGGVTVRNGSAGRNIRSVWNIATQPYPEAHFATYPEELVRRCILAGTSERGCCPECGGPWVRKTEKEATGRWVAGRSGMGEDASRESHGLAAVNREGFQTGVVYHTTGWHPSCNCYHPRKSGGGVTIPCTVLDPFFGSGTTGLVARKHGRRTIGIELSPSYCELAARRLQQLSLLAEA